MLEYKTFKISSQADFLALSRLTSEDGGWKLVGDRPKCSPYWVTYIGTGRLIYVFLNDPRFSMCPVSPIPTAYIRKDLRHAMDNR